MMDGAQRIAVDRGGFSLPVHIMGDGPLVLCLHGFPDNVTTWRPLLPHLAAKGFKAAALGLRGYTPEALPRRPVQLEDFRASELAADVMAAIEALGASDAHLVGHDWGATIAYAAAKLDPSKIRSLTALSIPSPNRLAEEIRTSRAQLKASSYILMFQLRGLAEWRIRQRNFRFFDRLYATWSPGWDGADAHLEGVKAAFRVPGVLEAALATYRAAAKTKDTASQALLTSPFSVPTLAVHGADDGCILSESFERAMRTDDFPEGLTTHLVDGAGHFVHLEKADLVNEKITDFLHAQPS